VFQVFRTKVTGGIRLIFAFALLLSTFAWGGAGTAGAAGQDDRHDAGAVYTLTNEVAGNHVVAFERAANGSLTLTGSYATGGLGNGSGLGSQGALVLSQDGRWLFAVNAGSNEISVLSTNGSGLALVDKVSSNGMLPVSLTVDKDKLYVLNAGGSGNISGFNVGHHGQLSAIPGSTRPLSGGATGPAQVQFSADGRLLAVTEKNTNMIDIYTVNKNGTAAGPMVYPSSGPTPFGFAFGRDGKLLVSEAFGGAPNASAASSYQVGRNGSLDVVTASATTHQTTACWLVLTGNERYAYTANAGSDSISGYSVGHDGALTLLDASGITGYTGAGSHPTDMALSNNSRYLYALTTFSHGISAFEVNSDGSLTPVAGANGLIATAVGLAAR
jgi:6-phosphogluconolactonase (cycloisomerase 2 family)